LDDVALVPPDGVVTVTSTVPVPLGAVAVMEVAESAVMVAAVEPKSTALALARLVPVIVTLVPAEPEVGLIEVTVGAVPLALINAPTAIEVPVGVCEPVGLTALETLGL
jgi:hypothetical protein